MGKATPYDRAMVSRPGLRQEGCRRSPPVDLSSDSISSSHDGIRFLEGKTNEKERN